MSAGEGDPKPRGVLVVDKPSGMTSHDVVARARRLLKTREVGHAGTLDPAATGVLVLGIGEGTKLLHYLSADDKAYDATITFGEETTTLDAEGEVVARAAVPLLTEALVAPVLASFVGTYSQQVPKVSAVRVDGERLHALARRGAEVTLPSREVRLARVELLALRERSIDVRLDCGKGFYVRSFARDVAVALGTLGHVSALRRTRSGQFALSDAVELPAVDVSRVRSLEWASGLMPRVVLDAQAAVDAFHGRAVRVAKHESDAPVALVSSDGALVAIAEWRDDAYRILRGFR